MARSLILTVVPIVCNIISLVLLCLVIFSGFNGHLPQFYWMKTNSGDFNAPAKLASSDFLSALSSITGTDYVGPSSSAASLNLPSWSGIHLLTECDHFADGSTECTDPSYGFSFSPSHSLASSSSLTGVVSDDLRSALDTYSSASRWLSGALIVATVSSLLAPVESFFTPLFAAFTSGLATLFLLAASITATVVFKKVVDAFNAQFAEYGLTASLGTFPIAFCFVACLLTLGATVTYTAANARRQRGGATAFGHGGVKGFGAGPGVGADSEYHGADPLGATRSKNGLFNRVTGTGHNYVQIDEPHGEGGDLGQRDVNNRGVPGSPDGIRPSRLDEDWAAPDDYASGGGGSGSGGAGAGAGGKVSAGPGASIPLMALGGNKQTKDLNTAYEPYSEPR